MKKLTFDTSLYTLYYQNLHGSTIEYLKNFLFADSSISVVKSEASGKDKKKKAKGKGKVTLSFGTEEVCFI